MLFGNKQFSNLRFNSFLLSLEIANRKRSRIGVETMDLSFDQLSCGTECSITCSDNDSQEDSAQYNPLVSPPSSPKHGFEQISKRSPIFLIFVTGVVFGGVCTLGWTKSINLTSHGIVHLRGEEILDVPKNESNKIILSLDGNDQPKISWLLSFPNSGK